MVTAIWTPDNMNADEWSASLLGAIFPPMSTDAASVIAPVTTIDAQPEKPNRENVKNVYSLLDADHQPIARHLRTYAFAHAAALRWSSDLGEPVGIYLEHGTGTLAPGATYEQLLFENRVDASAMSDDEFETAMVEAECARLENVCHALAEVMSDVRVAMEDARGALKSVKRLAKIDGMPFEEVTATARKLADDFECRAWYTLIDENDGDMLGELAADS